jgi:hypothetical protein
MEELSFSAGLSHNHSREGEYVRTYSQRVRDFAGAIDIPAVPFSPALLVEIRAQAGTTHRRHRPGVAHTRATIETVEPGPGLEASTSGISSPRPRLSEWPLYFGQRRQSSSAAFSCKNVGLLAAPSAIDYKQQVRLALKVSTPDESSAVDEDLAAAFVANRVGYTSATHSPPHLTDLDKYDGRPSSELPRRTVT